MLRFKESSSSNEYLSKLKSGEGEALPLPLFRSNSNEDESTLGTCRRNVSININNTAFWRYGEGRRGEGAGCARRRLIEGGEA